MSWNQIHHCRPYLICRWKGQEMKRRDRRMSDKEDIPELNGTIRTLVEMLSQSIETPQQQQEIIKQMIRLQLHTYLLQKQIHESLDEILDERKMIIEKIVDKFVTPFMYMLFIALVWLVFTNFKP